MRNIDYLTVEHIEDDELDLKGPGTRTLASGNVEVRLPIEDAVNPEKVGSIVPFELPPEAAVKFAAILLKRAGWRVEFRGEFLKARKTDWRTRKANDWRTNGTRN